MFGINDDKQIDNDEKNIKEVLKDNLIPDHVMNWSAPSIQRLSLL
jgi:hypothetical protein